MNGEIPVLGLAIWGAIYAGVVGFYGHVIRAADRVLDSVIRRLGG